MTSISAAAEQSAGMRRWWVLGTATLATMLYAMTVTVSYVVLPQMQGSLSATQDQIAWTVTFNLVATAVATPTSGWLAARFGRRAVMLFCIAGFSAATVLCGTATSLGGLVAYRVLQGGLGAPIVPLAQAIILDTFPRRQHGLVTVVWGMGVVIGPVIGPAIGGFVAEAYSWRWVFFMILPVCVLCYVAVMVFITDRRRNDGARLDWTGFIALSIAIAAFQLMLDRGERNDWFDSTEIILEGCLAAVAFYLFLVHSGTAAMPYLNPRLLLDRNFALGLIFAHVFGMLAFVPMVLLPPLLQELRGFPDSVIGIVLASRGVGSMIGNFFVIAMSRVDPRIGLAIGFGTQGLTGWFMAQFDINVTLWDVMWTSALQGFGTSFLWVPLTVLAFATLPARHLGEGTALFHLTRNLGSSIFISICVAMVIRSTSINYAVLSEQLSPFNKGFQLPSVAGLWNIEDATGLAALSHEVSRQAAMIGYINTFYLFAIAAFAVIPMIWLLRRPTGADT